MSIEDLIPEEEMVVTVTRDGYIKRTRSDNYRQQHRGGKGVKGAQLRADDVVEHFFVTTTHHWLLFFTTKGRVYRVEGVRGPRGRPRRQGSARREPAGAAARRGDRADPRHPRLHRRDLPRARHPQRSREEDAPDRVRHQPPGRRHRDQAPRETTRCVSAPARRRGRRHPAHQPARHVAALHGDR